MKWAHAFGYPHTSPEATEIARRYTVIRRTLAGRRAEWQLRAHVRVLRAAKAVERRSAEKISAAMVDIRDRNWAARSAASR